MADPQTEPAPERPDLGALLRFWQPALGLSDWQIRATYDRDLDGNLGRVKVVWQHREARIRILDPAMVTHDWPPHDVELHLLHELLHCVLDPVYEGAAKAGVTECLREEPVESLAKALVRLHRVVPLSPDWLAR